MAYIFWSCRSSSSREGNCKSWDKRHSDLSKTLSIRLGAETNASPSLFHIGDSVMLTLFAFTTRRLPGPPLSEHSSVGALLAEGVNVAIGVFDENSARNTRFNLAWVSPTLTHRRRVD